MINTPASFGKALNFGNPAGFPVWRAGETYEFPNAMGLFTFLQLESTPGVVYGPPFITGMAVITPTLSFSSIISPDLSFHAPISPVISRYTNIDEDA